MFRALEFLANFPAFTSANMGGMRFRIFTFLRLRHVQHVISSNFNLWIRRCICH